GLVLERRQSAARPDRQFYAIDLARSSEHGSLVSGGTESSQTRPWREVDSNLYGAFPVKWLFLVLLPVLCSEREGRSSSRRLRSGSRSARKGSRDRNASTA